MANDPSVDGGDTSLLPCPHCGGFACLDWRLSRAESRVSCDDCGASSGWGSDAFAVETWNTRATKAESDLAAARALVTDDLAALVVRLARALRKAAPGTDLPEKAMDYLKRRGLIGSPLRNQRAAP